MEWRHGTWQCPRCRFKLGCCEGEPQSNCDAPIARPVAQPAADYPTPPRRALTIAAQAEQETHVASARGADEQRRLNDLLRPLLLSFEEPAGPPPSSFGDEG